MLDWLAKLVTTRRALVLAVLLVVTAGLSTQIPSIQADPAPESLISSYEEDPDAIDAEALFLESFGDHERVMVILVRADDVLAPGPLQYIHDLSRHLEHQRWVDRVDSITVVPLPRRIRQGSGGGETLEDLDGGGETLDDLDGGGETLEDLEDLGPADDPQGDLQDDVFNALLDIIEADPDRFPDGIGQLGPTLSEELEVDPVVSGDRVTEAEARELAAAIDASPLIHRRLISDDRTLAAVALHIHDLDARAMRETVAGLRDYLVATPPPDGAQVHLAGLPYLRSTMVENMRSDQLVLIPITLLVCFLLLWISFQWIWGVVLPISAVVLTALMVVGGMSLVGEPMNVLNNIIPALLIIIGISDSIHLVGRYLEELARTGDKQTAGHRTICSMAVACLLTSITTAVGLGSLLVSRTVMLRHFGVTAAIGVMIAYVVTITFLPSIVTWAKPPKEYRHWGGWLEGLIMNVTARILQRPWVVLAGTAVLVIASIYGATKIEVDHALLDQFEESDPVYVTTRLMEQKLDGVRPLEVVLTSETTGRFDAPETIALLEGIERWAAERPEALLTFGFPSIVRESYFLISDDPTVRTEPFHSRRQVEAIEALLRVRDVDPLESWVTPDGRVARLQIKVRDVGAQATMTFIDDLEAEIARRLPEDSDIRVAFTGEAYTGSVGLAAVVGDLLGSLGTAVFIIFLLLAGLFRSVRLGLLSIPPNTIPLVGTMAYMVGRDIPLNAATVIIFSISIGLAVDGTIHVLARFREETHRGLRSNAALIRAARGTGRAIVVSGLTLMAGFSVLLMSSFVPVQHFGELIAVTVSFTLFSTLIVQPALLKVAGLSRSQKRAHREEDARIAAAAAARENGELGS